MPAYKDAQKGTWYAAFYYQDWKGVKKKKLKRGFPTKKEALAWERTFLLQQAADLTMTFEAFVEIYIVDKQNRLRENNYYEKICSSKQEKPFHEIVLQIGNKDDTGIHTELAETAKQCLIEYLDYAELQAKGHNPMHMADWESKLGDFLRFNGREVLENFGTVKREVAEKLALEQYEQYDANRRVLEASDDVDELTADVKRLKT